MPLKERLDKLLLARDLAPTRERAQALIMAGKVRVDGQPAVKPGTRVDTGADLEVAGKDHPFVSRGGVKLAAALDAFGVDPAGLRCLDIGASTGGFTDCLVQRGAARVHAVDVGYGQLAWSLRNHPAVNVFERTNIRNLPSDALEQPVHLVVIDVSFIALSAVLTHAVRFLAPGGRVLGLVKPQFEAGREHVGRGGRVTDEAVHAAVLDKVADAGERAGLQTLGSMPSPITGKKSGNVEFLVLWRLPAESEPEGSEAPRPTPEET